MFRIFLVKSLDGLIQRLTRLRRSLRPAKPKKGNGTPPVLHLTFEEKEADEKQARKYSESHHRYFGMPYSMQCGSSIFSEDELKDIQRYGSWLSALASGKIEPETIAQSEFTMMCHEIRDLSFKGMFDYYLLKSKKLDKLRAVWLKYLCRIKYERENPSRSQDKVEVDWGWQGPPIHSGDHVFFSK